MKTSFTLIIFLLLGVTCQSQVKEINFNTEIEKWKTELLLNGEVGPPCGESCEKWIEQNPHYYYGLDKIEARYFDFNADGIKDGLFFFSAVNCVCGNGWGSDFAMLVYSHKQQSYSNKYLSRLIEEKIGFALDAMSSYDHKPIYVTYESLGKTIKGKFTSWKSTDIHAGPSINGLFEYNPLDFEIKIKLQKEGED